MQLQRSFSINVIAIVIAAFSEVVHGNLYHWTLNECTEFIVGDEWSFQSGR